MSSLRVGGVTPLTTIDYPGELAAVVYCQGCPWRCRYCHNHHLLAADSAGQVDWHEVSAFLQRRRGLLDAVVFSGGEPTLQRALPDAIAEVRALGFKVGLHTAGCYPDRLGAVLPLLDWVGLDIKALPGNYAALTGVPGSGERAWQSLGLLLDAGVAHEVRVTVHDRLLPQAELDVLTARLYASGAQTVMLQGCRSGHMLDPALGENAQSWAAAPRLRAEPGTLGAAQAGGRYSLSRDS